MRRYVLRIRSVASANTPLRKTRLDFRIHSKRGIHVDLGSAQIAAAPLSNAAPIKRGWLEGDRSRRTIAGSGNATGQVKHRAVGFLRILGFARLQIQEGIAKPGFEVVDLEGFLQEHIDHPV